MLGSSDEPELPGGKPGRLGLILGIKNFSRDTSPNEDDPTLPVNPAYPPISMILLRSAQSLESIEYESWFERGGKHLITGKSASPYNQYQPLWCFTVPLM